LDVVLKTKIDLEVVNNDKQTSLHIAVQQGFFDITKKLFERGASLICLDDEKNNILHYSAQNGHLELLKYLLEKSPLNLISEKNIYGKTPKNVAKDIQIGQLIKDFCKQTNFGINDTNSNNTNQGIQIQNTTKENAENSKKILKKSTDPRSNINNNFNDNNPKININISTNIGNINNITNQICSLPSQSQQNSNKKAKVDNKSPKSSISKENISNNINNYNRNLNLYTSNQNISENNFPNSQTPSLNNNYGQSDNSVNSNLTNNIINNNNQFSNNTNNFLNKANKISTALPIITKRIIIKLWKLITLIPKIIIK
jgi:ankyrin repeat protein